MDKKIFANLKDSFLRAGKSLFFNSPIIIGVLILIGLARNLIALENYSKLFSNSFLDSFIGASLGSILAGNPITSYVVGGELLNQGISLIAITAFLVSWVTVGLVQMPAEILLLGKKYAITRNVVAFFSSILVAIITVGVISLI